MASILINGITTAVAVTVLVGATLWLVSRAVPRDGARQQRHAGPAEPDSTLAHAQITVGWASGTRRDWDRHVRPVLARQLDEALGARRSTEEARSAAGELLFGPVLWPLIDPNDRFTTQLDGPGPGRDALATILNRLESV